MRTFVWNWAKTNKYTKLFCDIVMFPPPVFFLAGSNVGGWGVHFLLLPDGRNELPPVAGPAGLVRPGGRASDARCHQEAEARRVWQHGGRFHELQPAGVLCGWHAARLSGGGGAHSAWLTVDFLLFISAKVKSWKSPAALFHTFCLVWWQRGRAQEHEYIISQHNITVALISWMIFVCFYVHQTHSLREYVSWKLEGGLEWLLKRKHPLMMGVCRTVWVARSV